MKKLLCVCLCFLLLGVNMSALKASGIKHIDEEAAIKKENKAKEKKTKLIYDSSVATIAKTKNYKKKDTYQLTLDVKYLLSEHHIDLRKVKKITAQMYYDTKLIKTKTIKLVPGKDIKVSNKTLDELNACGYSWKLFTIKHTSMKKVNDYRFLIKLDHKKLDYRFACKF